MYYIKSYWATGSIEHTMHGTLTNAFWEPLYDHDVMRISEKTCLFQWIVEQAICSADKIFVRGCFYIIPLCKIKILASKSDTRPAGLVSSQ